MKWAPITAGWYYLYDMDGRRLIDRHLNGGVYGLGHRNPEVGAAGRVFISGATPAVEAARMRMNSFLEATPGRDS